MFTVLICCLFVFLGMYIGNKYKLKNVSIYCIFGLFVINGFIKTLATSHYLLSLNYHDSTFFYLVLGGIIGYALMNMIGMKYEETDNLSIAGFSLFNTYVLFLSKFNFLFLLVNILYYVIIGIYIRNSKSWIYVFIGMVLGIIFGFIHGWMLGYIFSIIFSFVLYFIISTYSLVFKGNDKLAYYFLIGGIVVGLLGVVL